MPDESNPIYEIQIPQFLRKNRGGGAIGPFNADAVRREALRRVAAGASVGPSGTPIQQPPIQSTQALNKYSAGKEVGNYDPIYYAAPPLLEQIGTAARQAGIPQVAGMVDMLNLIDRPGSEYRRHMTLYPEDKNLPMDKQLKRVAEMRGKTYQPKSGEFGASKSATEGMSYSDYAEGEKNKFGITALGGPQGLPTKAKSTPATAPRPQPSSSVSRPAPAPQKPESVQTTTGSRVRTQQPTPAATTKTPQAANPKQTATQASPQRQSATPAASPAQSSSKANTTQAPSPRATQSGSPVKSQTVNPPTEQKSAPVAKAEPSGEALSYFRKNKTSPGWDALGTAVSLVQTSLTPEKGGLKSRTEYDRLLRGSDNFKKLDGNEQQRVRQAFAQWMNEQTVFKGKA